MIVFFDVSTLGVAACCLLCLSHSTQFFMGFLFCSCFPQDYSVLPAGIVVLQCVPVVSELCHQTKAVPSAAALHHLCTPAGDLPEAAMGHTAAVRGPSQQVSEL